MTKIPARPEGFGYEYVPAMDTPRGKTEPNWRVFDAQNNRIATCYNEGHCRLIFAALNRAAIVKDPTSVEMVREHAARLAELATRNGGPAGAELAGIAANLATAARRLGGEEPPTESVEENATIEDVIHDMRKVRGLRATKDGEFFSITPDEMRSVLRGRIPGLLRQPIELRREYALASDPYARGGFSFADLVDYSRQEITYHDAATGIMRNVRDRVIDDVHVSHQMLDSLRIAGGPLTARIGHMIAAASSKFTISGPTIGPEDVLRSAHSIASREARRSHGSGEPLADVEAVKIPRPDDVLADLDKLSGEDAFRVFDRVKVLPGNTAEARDWNLMDADDVRRMIAECCAVALNTGKLPELAAAAREAVARRKG